MSNYYKIQDSRSPAFIFLPRTKSAALILPLPSGRTVKSAIVPLPQATLISSPTSITVPGRQAWVLSASTSLAFAILRSLFEIRRSLSSHIHTSTDSKRFPMPDLSLPSSLFRLLRLWCFLKVWILWLAKCCQLFSLKPQTPFIFKTISSKV